MARQKVTAITKKLLLDLLAASNSAYNSENRHEFSCYLIAEDGVIIEFWLCPGTIESEGYAILSPHHLPIDFRRVGVAHSHPSGNITPSEADLHLFSQSGSVHIIMGYPFNLSSWKAFSRDGEEIHLDVV